MAQNDRHTDKQNHGHGDSMTDPAQRAESVKITLPSELMNHDGVCKAAPGFVQVC